MAKKLLLASTLLLLLAFNHAAQAQVCQRHREAASGFSMCVPQGWTVEERQGQKFKMMFAPRRETFTPNINFKDENNTAPLADYVVTNKAQIVASAEKIGATSLKAVDQTNFTTASGLKGIRLTLSTVYKGFNIRTLQYYFNGKTGVKLIVTSTFLEADRETLDKLFDSTVRSFQLD